MRKQAVDFNTTMNNIYENIYCLTKSTDDVTFHGNNNSNNNNSNNNKKQIIIMVLKVLHVQNLWGTLVYNRTVERLTN